jgi:hypothetical protein
MCTKRGLRKSGNAEPAAKRYDHRTGRWLSVGSNHLGKVRLRGDCPDTGTLPRRMNETHERDA